ncbi:hypothetical protein GEV33_003023 [Tenebrio molitor]|uniref:Uncharacterized protein n=1 Tax=Tenebrio molitor TaxID=7067 RepID=A0A8J6HUD0_TENMO|nr:hypothetical protein GEV33_003023 [Tenebrio molitor]
MAISWKGVEGESSHVLVCVLFLPRVVPRRSPFVSVPLGTIGEGQQPRYHWLPLGFKGVVPPAIQPRLSPRRLSSSLASSTAVLSTHSVPFDRWYQGRTEQNAVVLIATKIRGEHASTYRFACFVKESGVGDACAREKFSRESTFLLVQFVADFRRRRSQTRDASAAAFSPPVKNFVRAKRDDFPNGGPDRPCSLRDILFSQTSVGANPHYLHTLYGAIIPFL